MDRTHGRRSSARRSALVGTVLLVLLLSSLPASRASRLPGAVSATGPGASPLAPAAPNPTYFQNQKVPFPTNASCPFGSLSINCFNGTAEPSINYTSMGLVAMAYTALTNETPCVNATAYAQSVIGFTTAKAPGKTWSRPIYLADPTCSTAGRFPSAWQPSLTSLPNGTLALTYIQFNATPGETIPTLGCSSVNLDRLVFTRSFDNGTTWTTPLVLNNTPNLGFNCPIGFAQRPWIADFGQTLYVVWENLTADFGSTTGAVVHLRVSTNGGSTWGRTILLPTTGGGQANYSVNPTVATDSSGRVYVAYASNYSAASFCSAGICNVYNVEDVVVATSTNNGTAFNFSIAASQVPVISWNSFMSPVTPYTDPAPQLAWGHPFHQMFVAYTGGSTGSFCNSPPSCFSGGTLEPNVFIANSSTLGRSWSSPHPVSPALLNTTVLNSPANGAFNPAMAVDASGRLHFEMGYTNDSVCANLTASVVCGVLEELYLNSTNNGTSFSPPVVVNGNLTPLNPPYQRYMWDGAYSSLVTHGPSLYLAYTAVSCPGWNISTAVGCAWGSNGTAQVSVAEPYVGPGISLTFQSRGLPAGVNWSVALLGVNTSGPSSSSIVFSGVPPGQTVSWSVAQITGGYGTIYTPANGTFFLGNFSASRTITVNFSELILVNVAELPLPPGVFPFQASLSATPQPGPYWIRVGQPLSLNITSNPCTGCDEFALSFLSWSGTGPGSYSGRSPNVTVFPTGPVNETANFQLNGYCTFNPTFTCQNYTFGLTFIENGLPNGSLWSVTLDGRTLSNSTTVIPDPNATAGPHSFTVWTEPTVLPGREWVGVASRPSPVLTPAVTLVVVTFTLVPIGSTAFPIAINATGLPARSNWSVQVGVANYGVTTPTLNLSAAGGSFLVVNGSALLGPNGTSYRVASITSNIAVENSTGPVVSPPPASIRLNGSAWLTLHFTPFDRVTVTTTTGGTAGPAAQWVAVGGSVTLRETPDPGYLFQGWTGSVSAVTPSLTFVVNAPAREVASFHPIPTSTWSVQLNTIGLPAAVNATFQIGGKGLSGPAGTVFGNFSTGWYAISASNLVDPAGGARYLVTASELSVGGNPNGTAFLSANTTLTISYLTQFAVVVVGVGAGTTTPAPGTYWVNGSTSLNLSALPASRDRFLGWSGIGTGSVNSTALSISVFPFGGVTESAAFAPRPPGPPPTYVLTVKETGLPPGSPWSVTGAGAGGASTAGTLVVAGLNGSYTIFAGVVILSPGIRYAPDLPGGYPVVIAGNRSIAVSYHLQFLLTVLATPGGSAGPPSGWWNSSVSVALTESSASGSLFAGWTGEGTGSFTGAAPGPNVTLGGPILEIAHFSLSSSGTSIATKSGGANVPFLAALLLLIAGVGVLLAALLVRGRRGRAREPLSPRAESGEEVESPAEYVEEPAPQDPAQSSGDLWNESEP